MGVLYLCLTFLHPNTTEVIMQSIEDLLIERGRTHGDYGDHAQITQQLKDVMRYHDGWTRLNSTQRETLDMLAHKTGRILAGDPNFADHWDDIAGYAKLVSQRITQQSNH